MINYSYEDFQSGIVEIAQQIHNSGWQIDYLVGVVRGGAIPAAALSHRLNKPVAMLHWNTRDFSVNGNETNAWIPEDLEAGKHVLLVDDIVDSGQTIEELLEDWAICLPNDFPRDNIRIASMFYNPAQDVPVDYYHKIIDRRTDSRWIKFPWEM